MRDALKQDHLLGVYSRVARRYDLQHGLLTLWSDQRSRRTLVRRTVRSGDEVLDAGAGTGSTALLAAREVGPDGMVHLFDFSAEMLQVANRRAVKAGLPDRMTYHTGNLLHLPFGDATFDVVLSTYSLCPVYNPAAGARELYRIVKPGGKLGIAHSAEPARAALKWLALKVENLVWHFPTISMGCRAVEVFPALIKAGGEVLFSKMVGVPLWPFQVLVISKPA